MRTIQVEKMHDEENAFDVAPSLQSTENDIALQVDSSITEGE